MVAHAPDQLERRRVEVLDVVADECLPPFVRGVVLQLAHGQVEVVAFDEVEKIAPGTPDLPVVNPGSPMRLDQVVGDALVDGVVPWASRSGPLKIVRTRFQADA